MLQRRQIRSVLSRAALSAHHIGLKAGIIVLPKHYYVPFPDLGELRRTSERWARRSEMIGIRINLDEQIDYLRRHVQQFEPEYRGNTAFKVAVEGAFGPGYGPIEAQALHGMIRSLRPKRIIEIGSGVSTYCMLQALQKNADENSPSTLTCIEPYPSDWLQKAPVTLIRSRVQEIDFSVFDQLSAGDLLFIDSTHTVHVDSDVNKIILEFLPRIAPGVIVHFHDIAFPYDFLPNVQQTLFHWMETALLHAFLINNSKFEILFCMSHLHHDRTQELKDIFPDYEPKWMVNGLQPDDGAEGDFPSSIYLRTREA